MSKLVRHITIHGAEVVGAILSQVETRCAVLPSWFGHVIVPGQQSSFNFPQCHYPPGPNYRFKVYIEVLGSDSTNALMRLKTTILRSVKLEPCSSTT